MEDGNDQDLIYTLVFERNLVPVKHFKAMLGIKAAGKPDPPFIGIDPKIM